MRVPVFSPKEAERDNFASGKISIIDTYIITPAEKPRLVDKNFVFVVFEKSAIMLPIPVERPAMRVNKKARNTLFIQHPIPRSINYQPRRLHI
jgi:hypothetical protein